jgi:hypothetical protein
MIRRIDTTGIVAGIIFIVIGAVFLLDRLDVWDLDFAIVWPIVLIALGGLVLLGALIRRG